MAAMRRLLAGAPPPMEEDAHEGFSLRDRHVIISLARQHKDGKNIEFLLWDELRVALRGHIPNITELAARIKSTKDAAADAQHAYYEKHCVRTIEQVINEDITLDEALSITCQSTMINMPTLHLLLSRGADPNVECEHGRRPLHLACLRNLYPAAELILEYHADFTIACHAGYTPLHYACLGGAVDCAVLLRKMGASLEVRNRAGHMPLESCDGTGFAALHTKLDRAVEIRTEALVRAKRFYIKIMQGDEDYVGPPEKRSTQYETDKIMAAVMLKYPSYISGKRERLRLVPADLDNLPRLLLKTLGPKHEKKMSWKKFKYTEKRYFGRISKVLFEGKISAKQVGAAIADGEERYQEMCRVRDETAAVRSFEKAFEDFIDWMRNPDEIHARYIMYHINALCEGRSPICKFNVISILEVDTAFSVYQWQALNFEEKGVLASLRQMFIDREFHLLADDSSSEEEESEADEPKVMGIAARMALQASEEANAKRLQEIVEEEARQERHDRGSFTATTDSGSDGTMSTAGSPKK